MRKHQQPRFNLTAKIVIMNSSTSNIVVIGKDNWLFTDVNESMADYRGLTQLSESQLAYVLEIVESERDYLNGIPLILVVAPNKESVYPEYMPDNIKKTGSETKLDQVLTYFKDNSDIQIIDLRPVLIEGKKDKQVYRKNDSHWNSYGSYLAYREIIGATGLTAHELSDYNEVVNVDEKGGSTGDLSRALKMEDMYPETEVIKRYELKDVPSDRLPSALIFHDSFYSSTNLQALLAPHFEKVTEVRYGQISLFSSELVEKSKPSVVIYIMVERVLTRYFMPWN